MSAEAERVRALGFELIGDFSEVSFSIRAEWAWQKGLYLWVEPAFQVRRVGIACGASGFRGRYAGYNRWLAGRFKLDDAREQKVRSLFLSRLSPGWQVWGRAYENPKLALSEERRLRAEFGDALDLDLMAKGSWGSEQMKAWRSAQPRLGVRTRASPADEGAAPVRTSTAETARRFETMLVGLGLTAIPVATGTSYKLGRFSLCRIDPKADFLRVQVSEDDELSAPVALRGSYAQRGWLIVRPEDAPLGIEFVRASVARRLSLLRR